MDLLLAIGEKYINKNVSFSFNFLFIYVFTYRLTHRIKKNQPPEKKIKSSRLSTLFYFLSFFHGKKAL